MKEEARIIETKDNKAIIRIVRRSACSKCDQNCSLAGSSHEMDEIKVEVENSLGAKEGSLVQVEMKEQPLVVASLIVYLLPLVILIMGYFTGAFLATSLIPGLITENMAGILGSILGLAFSFLLIRLIDRKLSTNSQYHPKITRIIN